MDAPPEQVMLEVARCLAQPRLNKDALVKLLKAEVKFESKEEEEEEDNYLFHATSNIKEQGSEDVFADHHSRRNCHSRRLIKCSNKPVISLNKARLSSLLGKMMKGHRWKEASGVLSVLLKGTPRGCSFTEDQRNFLVAMEIHRRCKGIDRFEKNINQILKARMHKLVWGRKCPQKKQSVILDLALFYLSQGNEREAYHTTKSVIQKADSVGDSKIILLHGLLLYQIWYSGLPKEKQVKGSDIQTPLHVDGINNGCKKSQVVEIWNDHNAVDNTGPNGSTVQTPLDENGMDSELEESEMVGTSNDHYAVDNTGANISYEYASESSVGNGKMYPGCSIDIPHKQLCDTTTTGFYMDGTEETNSLSGPNSDQKVFHNSILFSHEGLDKDLLPLQLKCLLPSQPKNSTVELEQVIRTHRDLLNEDYADAVKYLRLAFHSSPPLLAALQPLTQLLLFGDQVEEALKELEEFCCRTDSVLPFRLKAKLLESFWSNQSSLISSCYENILKRDPTCTSSLEKLIKMHKYGRYNTMALLEMIALHLDAVPGNVKIWGGFASCFLQLLTDMQIEYEDGVSTNERILMVISSSKSIPESFTEGHTRDSWRLRCRWWATRHFSMNSYMLDAQTGVWMLLACKAACAAHLYGPRHQYVVTTLSILRKEGNNDLVPFVCQHMHKSMKMQHHLD